MNVECHVADTDFIIYFKHRPWQCESAHTKNLISYSLHIKTYSIAQIITCLDSRMPCTQLKTQRKYKGRGQLCRAAPVFNSGCSLFGDFVSNKHLARERLDTPEHFILFLDRKWLDRTAFIYHFLVGVVVIWLFHKGFLTANVLNSLALRLQSCSYSALLIHQEQHLAIWTPPGCVTGDNIMEFCNW